MTNKDREVSIFRTKLALEATKEALRCIEYAGYTDVARRHRRDIENFKMDIEGLKSKIFPFATVLNEV